MDFDDQLRRYFGTDDPAAIAPGALEAGIEKMRVDFGMEKDRSRRFALWTLLYMFGGAPIWTWPSRAKTTGMQRGTSWT